MWNHYRNQKVWVNYKEKEEEAWENSVIGKDKLNTSEVLISKPLIDSYLSHGKLVSMNKVLSEYNEMKEEIKNPETSVEYII